MDWLRRMMMGRYGSDQLAIGGIVLYMALTFIAGATGFGFLTVIAYALAFWCVFRIFSRNISKRYEENRKFLLWWNPILGWIKEKITVMKESKVYCFLKCPACGAKIRVPRGRGKIEITCPKCANRFIKKT